MYKKIRFYFRLFVAFFSKYILLIALGMVLSGFTVLLLPRLISHLPRFRQTQRIGIIGNYSLPDMPLSVLSYISLGLTTVDDRGLPAPGLADHWQVSPDGKSFTFFLKQNLKWQDGSPVKSSDIRYQFRDAVFDYPDNTTLLVRLREPFAPLPVLLSKPILKMVKSGILSRNKFIGVGNYRISGYQTNGQQLESIVLYPVDNNSLLPTLIFYFYPSPQQARTAFKLGLLDKIENITDPMELNKWPNTEIITQSVKNRYVGLFFNTQDPLFSGQSGKNLRLALTYAIDKSIWKYRAYGPENPDSWAFNPDVKKYDFDTSKAAELLKKVENIPQPLKLSTVPAYINIADIIKKDFENINIKTQISVFPEIPTDFQILLVAQVIPVDPDQYNLWHSTQDLTNLTSLNNPRIDKLLEDGRKTYDQTQRKNIYFDFQKYLVEENPVIFLYYPESYSVYKK